MAPPIESFEPGTATSQRSNPWGSLSRDAWTGDPNTTPATALVTGGDVGPGLVRPGGLPTLMLFDSSQPGALDMRPGVVQPLALTGDQALRLGTGPVVNLDLAMRSLTTDLGQRGPLRPDGPLLGGDPMLGGDTNPVLSEEGGYCGRGGRRVYVPFGSPTRSTPFFPASPCGGPRICFVSRDGHPITIHFSPTPFRPTCRPPSTHCRPYFESPTDPRYYTPTFPAVPHTPFRPPHRPEVVTPPRVERPDAPYTPTPVRTLDQERAALTTATQAALDSGRLSRADFDRMRADMATLEARGLRPEQVAAVFAQSTRLLTATEGAIGPEARVRWAGQILHSAAVPTDIVQVGPTCGMSSTLVREYINHPERAAAIAGDLAILGRAPQLRTPSGEVRLDRADMAHLRNADHGMQWALVNFEQQMRNPNMRYHVRTRPGSTDTYDYLENLGAHPRSRDRFTRYPGITALHTARVNEYLDGRRERTVLVHGRGTHDSLGLVDSPDALHRTLVDAAAGRNGVRFPIQCFVHTGHEPWRTDSGRGSAPGSGGWHFVTITGYDPVTRTVRVDNTWPGSASRRDVPLNQMFTSMTAPRR